MHRRFLFPHCRKKNERSESLQQCTLDAYKFKNEAIESLGIEKINLVGLATDFCVNYSAQDAAKLGYKVSVFEKMCRSIDINGSLALAKTEMRECGVELI